MPTTCRVSHHAPALCGARHKAVNPKILTHADDYLCPHLSCSGPKSDTRRPGSTASLASGTPRLLSASWPLKAREDAATTRRSGCPAINRTSSRPTNPRAPSRPTRMRRPRDPLLLLLLLLVVVGLLLVGAVAAGAEVAACEAPAATTTVCSCAHASLAPASPPHTHAVAPSAPPLVICRAALALAWPTDRGADRGGNKAEMRCGPPLRTASAASDIGSADGGAIHEKPPGNRAFNARQRAASVPSAYASGDRAKAETWGSRAGSCCCCGGCPAVSGLVITTTPE